MACDSSTNTKKLINIPSDIITQILCLLPTKSVGRLRCVSKEWLSLLSSPQFIKTHQQTLNQNHLICFSNTFRSLYSLPIDHTVLTPTKLHFKSQFLNSFSVHGSCNGLVLVMYVHDSDYVHSLVVLNPTTSECIVILEFSYMVIDSIMNRKINYGFGYDSVTDDYKVVAISYLDYNYWNINPHDNIYVHVYSLRTNTWTRSIDHPYDNSHSPYASGVFVNGFIHWFAINRSDNSTVISAFSLADEKFYEVPSPNVDIDGNLVDLGGKLGIFLKVEGEVWLMNEYGVKESWSKIILQGLDDIHMLFRPVFFYDNGKITVVDCYRLLIYDVEEKCFSKDVEISQKHLQIKGTYVESLVSPKLTRIN